MDLEARRMNVFLDIFKGLEHLGPGGRTWTLQALERIKNLPDKPDILDVGCGSGVASILLAIETGGRVTALDFYDLFLDDLRNKISSEGLDSLVFPVQGDMKDMPFDDESFDLIWSEGAIYNMGFEAAVRDWRRFLRPGGYIAVSDAILLEDPLPDEPRSFWEDEGIVLKKPEELVAVLESEGYQNVEFFILPSEAWIDNYYLPIEKKLKKLSLLYCDDPVALEVVENFKSEIDIYRRWGHTYSYAFFTAVKKAF